jgi:putative ABC transport system permease protein
MSWILSPGWSMAKSSRVTKGIFWLESVLQDLRFGIRILRKNIVVTMTAVLSLSLAIGACSAAFTLVDSFFLRPLPVQNPGRLVYLLHSAKQEFSSDYDTYFSWECLEHLAEASRGLIDLFGYAWANQPVIFDDSGGEEERLETKWISGDGFRILGIQPAIGRVLTSADDGHPVAVLGYSFWTQRFRASPTVLGRWLDYRGTSYQIVGVTQKGFSGLFRGYRTDVWFPKIAVNSWEMGLGQLKPGVAPERARQVLQAALTNFRREHPDEFARFAAPGEQLQNFLNAPLKLRGPGDIRSSLRADWQRPLWILAAVTGLVLLIACSNVANLLLARAAGRESEMALRISMGAGRMRLVQQLLIESSMVAGAACILGLAIAWTTAPSIVSLMSPKAYHPFYEDLHLDLRILPFLALLGIIITVLFVLAPALRASAVSPHEELKAAGTRQSGTIGILRPLLASQVGLSFTVLFVGGLLLISFHRLTSVDLGFSKNGVLLVEVGSKSLDRDKAWVAEWQLLDRIRRLPSVQAVGMSNRALAGGEFGPRAITSNIRFAGRESERLKPYYLAISPGFLETMQIHLLDGRDLAVPDTSPGTTAVVVNRSFVRHYLSGENPIGRRFDKIGSGLLPVTQEVVGVVQDAKYNNLREPYSPTVYEPLRTVNGTLEVRTSSDPLEIASRLRTEIRRFRPELHLSNMMLQSTRIENSLLRERLLALLAGFFATVAIALVAIGMYGVLSYSVVRRSKEIGIRVALGARQSGIVHLVTFDIMRAVAVGLAVGVAGGLTLARFVTALLFEVIPSGFWSLVLPLACLLLAAGLAVVAPAFRAARIDPIVALRQE